MRPSRPGWKAAVLFLAVLGLTQLLPVTSARSQQSIPGLFPPVRHSHADGTQFPDANPVVEAKRNRQLNAERQKSIITETAKLLRLAEELKKESDSETADTSRSDQMRKVAEIEKLARSVKDKMIYTMEGPTLHPTDPYSVIGR